MEMNESKVLLETGFADSLGEGTFTVKIVNHLSNLTKGPCVEVEIKHSLYEDLSFCDTFAPENFPANLFQALPRDWGHVEEEIKTALQEVK